MIKTELSKMFRSPSIYLAIVLGTLSCASGLFSYYDTASWSYSAGMSFEISAYNAWLDCLSVGSSIYRLIVPLLIVPFLDSYFNEKKSGYQYFILSRNTKKSYYITKWGVGVISSAFIVFIILFITFLICLVLFPLNQPIDSMTHLHKNFGLSLFLKHPAFSIFLLILSNLYFSAVYYTISFGFINVIHRRFVLLLIPFFLYLLQLIIWQFFNLPCFSPLIFIAYYEVVGLTPNKMIVTGIVYFLVALLMFLFGYWSDKDL